ncbi:MAG TPA: hypothetical protein VF458_02665 [Ktedonobacteraceae bacterium]
MKRLYERALALYEQQLAGATVTNIMDLLGHIALLYRLLHNDAQAEALDVVALEIAEIRSTMLFDTGHQQR